MHSERHSPRCRTLPPMLTVPDRLSTGRLRTVRHEGFDAMSITVLAQPHRALRPYIAGVYMGWSENSRVPTLRRELPTPIVPLILNFESPFDIAPADCGGKRIDSFVAGLTDVFTEVTTTGPSSCIQINLTLIGALVLFGMPLGPIAGLTISPDDALPSPWHRLAADLAILGDWSARLCMLEEFLLKRLGDDHEIPRQLIGAQNLLFPEPRTRED